MAMDQLYTDTLTELEQAKVRIAELEEREAALAAHVELSNKLMLEARIVMDDFNEKQYTVSQNIRKHMGSLPSTSLARRDLINQAHGIADFAFTWDWERAPNRKDMRQTASFLRQQAEALK